MISASGPDTHTASMLGWRSTSSKLQMTLYLRRREMRVAVSGRKKKQKTVEVEEVPVARQEAFLVIASAPG